MNVSDLRERIREEAYRLDFDLVGFCRAERPQYFEHFRCWLDSGRAAKMEYLARRLDAYRTPQNLLPGAQSIVMLGVNYRTTEPKEAKPGEGRFSRYAWGADYHDLIRKRLKALGNFHHQLTPGVKTRGVVDTAPFFEREYAWRAGLGWIGKNNLLINERFGSWLFLAALLTTEPLGEDGPVEESKCGDCRICLDACPTGALESPHCIDARRCLSYLTVEPYEPIPAKLRNSLGNRLFGCDACQEKCPFNRRKTPSSSERQLLPTANSDPVSLATLFEMGESEFLRRFDGTPIKRTGRNGLLRNAAVILGNHPCENGFSLLENSLQESNPTVRAAAIWAFSRYGKAGYAMVTQHRAKETDRAVLQEIDLVLK